MFNDRPWQSAGGVALPISTGASYEGKGLDGLTTRVDPDGKRLRLTFSDGGQIHLDARSRTITFRTRFGTSLTY
jgi:hypothetical protein